MHCLRSSERTAMPCLSSCNASVVMPSNNMMLVQVMLLFDVEHERFGEIRGAIFMPQI